MPAKIVSAHSSPFLSPLSSISFNKMKCHVLNQFGVVEELLPSSKMGGMTLYIFSA